MGRCPCDGACQICHEEGGCVSVCGCKGSVAAVHLSCLESWRKTRPGSMRCELCNTAYSMRLDGRIKLGKLSLNLCIGVAFLSFCMRIYFSSFVGLICGGLAVYIAVQVRPPD